VKSLIIGHSPDADDAFMFYALAGKHVRIAGYKIDHAMEDIESLNRRAATAELPVTAISAAVYPEVAKHYRIMSCGASVGRGYGPIMLAREPLVAGDLAGRRIAVPGPYTTAFLLLRLFLGVPFDAVHMDFDAIIDAVRSGEVDAGVIIHEGQLTWKKSGLYNVLDLGRQWTSDTELPIPLGLDVIRRDLGGDEMQRIATALKKSIIYAREHEDDAIDYAIEFGRGIDRATCRDFVRMYVNDDTVDLGEDGRRALEMLYGRAAKRGLLSTVPPLDIITA